MTGMAPSCAVWVGAGGGVSWRAGGLLAALGCVCGRTWGGGVGRAEGVVLDDAGVWRHGASLGTVRAWQYRGRVGGGTLSAGTAVPGL